MESQLLSKREIRRYSKQIMIPEIGLKGQELIKQAKVIVVGAGGLGCPLLQYLTAAGIGKIAIVEFDKVDESNLQRQVLYGSSDVGKLKSIIVKSRLEHLNNYGELEIINLRLDATNALKILGNYDILVDATDNLEARYTISDAAIVLNKPMVHGSIYKFESMVSVFNFSGGPSYRDYNPSGISDSFKNPVPAQTGLFGVLPGITGTFMANEVIKIITGVGEVLSGKMLMINTISNTFKIFTINNYTKDHTINEKGN